MMADMQDDRIPVRFASPAQVGAGDVLLVEDGAVQPLLRADCTIIRFRTGGARVVRPGSARSRRIRCGTGNRGQLPAGGTLPPFGLEGAGRTIGRTQIT